MECSVRYSDAKPEDGRQKELGVGSTPYLAGIEHPTNSANTMIAAFSLKLRQKSNG